MECKIVEQRLKNKVFTEDDLNNCWNPRYHITYFLNLLNKETSVDTAREDLFSLVGSRFDARTPNVCDTAPYPECNGANGCDTCDHQPED